jgi:predicted permease
MKFLDSLRFRISTLFQRSHMNADMDEELRSHIQLRADDLERSGLPRSEAERQARIEFGSFQGIKEECQDSAGGRFVESMWQDVRYAIRVLRKSPAFTVVAVATLALAIGANAVVFAALNALILRPLDLPQAENLFELEWGTSAGSSQSYPNYIDFRDRNRSFDDVLGYTINVAALDTDNNPARAWIVLGTGNYFDGLRIRPHLGRFFHPSDERGPNSAPYLVLGYDYWHARFHSDTGVIGRVVLVNKHPFTIIGVAPPAFHGTLLFFTPDCYAPIVNEQQFEGEDYLNARSKLRVFSVIGRLKPGVTHAQAIEDLNSIGADLQKTYPQESSKFDDFRLGRPGLYGDFLGRPVRGFLTGLMLLAGLILLAACANLGTLFAARASDRSREVALRLALGSSRRRILRQLLTEAVLIALVGGGLGLWGSILLLRALTTWQPLPRFPIHVPVHPDTNVYILALLLAFVSGILFGLVPLRQVQQTDPYQVIKSGTNGIIGRRLTGRDLLLASQIAICAVLVTASMVAVRGLVRALNGDYGFNPQNVLLVDTDVAMAGHTGDSIPEMQKRMIHAVEAIPGVMSVALTDWPPLSQDWQPTAIYPDQTTDLRPANVATTSYMFKISPEYFRTAGTTLMSGRIFNWHDDKDAPRVAVVNQEFGRRIFGAPNNAIGNYFKLKDGSRIQVVGVVENGKYATLTENQKAAFFVPFLQSTRSQTWLMVRSERGPDLTTDIRDTLHNLDAGLALNIGTWTRELDGALFAPRIATISLGVLGFMGAMLSITGVFGMAAYTVSRRMRELGIRMALGAQQGQVLKAALGRAFKLLAIGSGAGLILGLLATKVLAVIVYQATPRDPLVLAGVVLAMALLGLLATWIPAQRALGADPMLLLREE